jgi:hypothetical protein
MYLLLVHCLFERFVNMYLFSMFVNNHICPYECRNNCQLFAIRRVIFYLFAITFLAHLSKGHVSFCHHLASVVRRKLSHFKLLLKNHWANCNQTLVE